MKRYAKYKDSGVAWIGEVPSDWNVNRLGYLGTLSAGGLDKKTVEGETLVKSVHYMNVYRASLQEILNSDEYLIVSATPQKLANCTLNEGDVLFTTSSETPEDIGHSCVVGESLQNTLFGYHLMKAIIDRFGDKVETKTMDREHFKATVEASCSPTFFAWIFTYAGKLKILSPKHIVAAYKEHLTKALDSA